MKSHLTSLTLAATALLFFSCDRERSNPIDPQSSVLAERPTTPTGLVAQDGVGRILIGWQPVEEGDLAGYGIYRASQSNGIYEFVPGDGDSTLQITTGKTTLIDSLDVPGTTFFYRVTAVDTVGLISERSNFVGATVLEDMVPPETPLNLSTVAVEDANDRVIVRWTVPRVDSDGSELSGLSGFVIFRSENSTGFVAIDTLAGDVQEFVDSGLEALTVYSYRVMAFDEAGNSSPLTSPQQTETRGLQVPPNLSAVGQIEQISISWSGIENLDLLGYNVLRSTRADDGFEQLPSVEGSAFTTGQTTYIDSNLTGGETFFYRVQAVGKNGLLSEFSGSIGAEVLADELAPGAPKDVSAVPGTDNFNQVSVTWKPPTRDAAGGELTGLIIYNIYRSEETNTSFVLVGSVDANMHQFIDQGVEESTTYFYAVTSVDAAANEGPRTGPIQIRTKGADKVAPQAPQNVSAVPSADDFGRITVRWSPSVLDSDNTELTGLTNYFVFRSEGSINSFVPVATLGPEAREFVDSGLDPLTTYFYTISAVDEAGNEGARAITVQVSTEGPDRIAPQSPSNVSAVASETDFGQVTVRWSPVIADADGGELTGLAGYVVFRAEGGSSFVPVDSLQADAREYRDTGLRPLTSYSYRVLAYDEVGNESAVSNSAQIQTMGVTVPLNLTAVAGIARIELTWKAVEDPELLGYNLYRSILSDQGYELLPNVDGGAAFTTGHTTYVDSNLTEGQQFFYKVQAVANSGQLSELSGFVGAIADGDQIAPEAPRNIAAVPDPVNFGQVVITWSPVLQETDGTRLTALQSYAVFRSKDTNTAFVQVATVAGDITQFVDSGLDVATTYFYAVIAIDPSGNESARPNPVQVRTEGPDQIAPQAPSNVSAVADEANFGQVTVRWSPSVRDADGSDLTGLQSYVVFRSKDTATAFVPVDTLDASAREFTDGGLEQLTTYFYTVSALDDKGNESARANSVQVQTEGPDQVAPQSPSNVSAVADEANFGQVTVRWSPSVRDADGNDLTGLQSYIVFRSKGSANSFVRVAALDDGVREFVDGGLEELTTYFYTVSAIDAAGNESARAAAVQVRTEGPDQIAPQAPSNVSAVADEANFGQVTVRWSPSVRDADGSDLTGLQSYVVFRSKDTANAFVPVDTLDASAREFTDDGLEQMTTYFYSVTAIDADGNESSRASSVQVDTEGPDQVAPQEPSNVSAVADEANFGQVTVRWSPSVRDADGNDLTGLQSYIVFRSKGSTNSFMPVATVAAAAREFVDGGLEQLTTYFYTISAIDAAGNESARAAAVQVRTEGPDQIAPQAPSNVSAVADEANFGQVTVRWSPSVRDADQGDLTGMQSYIVFRSKSTANSFVPVDTLDASAREFVDDGLEQLTTYFYTVTAIDPSGNESARATNVQVRTEGPDQVAPEAPSNLSAVADETEFGRITLRWSPSVRDADGGDLTGLQDYIVFRSEGTASSFVPVDTLGATVREYEDLNLNLLTDYFYTVTAIDEAGNESARAVAVQVRTEGPDQVAPATPQNVSAVADEVDFGRVVVRWSPSVRDADGGDLTGLQSYIVFRSKGTASSFVPIDTLAATVREYEDLNLNSLTDYFYTVTAIDEAGNESARAVAVQVRTEGPDQVAPATPQNVSAVADEVDFGRVVVRWSPSVRDADGGDLTGLNGYVIFRSTGSVNAFVPIDTLAADARQFEDLNLNSLTTYFYTLMAFDEAGNESGRATSVQVLTNGPDQVAPAAPTDLAAIADLVAGQITVSWSPSVRDADGGDLTGLATYIVLRSKDDASSFSAIDTVNSSSTSFVDSGLEASTTYFYAVRAVDDTGNASSRSATISATTAGIAVPTGISVVGDIRRITVTWDSSPDENLLGYNIYRSTRSDQGYARLAGVEGTSYTTGQTTYIDSGLTGGVTFFYRIAIVTSAGESDRSAFQGATVDSDTRAPAAPTFVDGEPVTENPEYLNLTWKPPTTDLNGATLTGLSSYLIYRSAVSTGPFELVGTSTTAAFTDTGLTAVTTYYYQVEASDEGGNVSNRSTGVALTTGGVQIPSNVWLASSTPSNIAEAPTVTITWDASAGAILEYEVERTTVANSTNDSDFTAIVPNSLATSREDNTVVRGTTYYYRVRARDVDDRVSDWTALVSVEVKN